jgi:hypothetical protein
MILFIVQVEKLNRHSLNNKYLMSGLFFNNIFLTKTLLLLYAQFYGGRVAERR